MECPGAAFKGPHAYFRRDELLKIKAQFRQNAGPAARAGRTDVRGS
jgi:hypothetical protein